MVTINYISTDFLSFPPQLQITEARPFSPSKHLVQLSLLPCSFFHDVDPGEDHSRPALGLEVRIFHLVVPICVFLSSVSQLFHSFVFSSYPRPSLIYTAPLLLIHQQCPPNHSLRAPAGLQTSADNLPAREENH